MAQAPFDVATFLAGLGLQVSPGDSLSDIAAANPQAALGLILALLAAVALPLLLARGSGSGKPKTFLDPSKFQPLPLVERVELNYNTRRYRFALPHPKMALGLPVGQHITFLARDEEGKDVFRPYTPTSDNDQLGFVDFVVKIYPGGKMGAALERLRIGDTLLIKGPRGRFKYTPNMKRAIGMIAGGTGITPMYQVAQTVLRDSSDRTTFSLLFANVAPEDILIKEELDKLAAAYPGRFKVYYVLNKPPAGWKGGSGFISADMIKTHLPAPAADVLILRCGPRPMCDAINAHLDALGYSEEMKFEF